MSTARHHVEWLSLVETSGPFLSLPVLLRTFPHGLDAHDPEDARDLRLALEEWEDSPDDPAIHTGWVRFVLTRVLELPDAVLAMGQAIPGTLRVAVAEHGESLAPDLIVHNPSGRPDSGQPRLLVQVYPRGQDLGRPVAGRHWKASPETRTIELLRGVGARLGLTTNGEHWMLVNVAPAETAGVASWYASLWVEEPLTLRAFRSLLGVRRFFGVPDGDTPEALLDESASAQQEVTEQLGYQVRRAVEVLVQALDRTDKDHGRALLQGVPETRLYEAAVTVMMRLVFLFAAEERGLLLLGDPLFDQHYAVSTLRTQLRSAADDHGEEVLEHRVDAWVRLLATFRAVHGGIRHDRLTLPAYGGSLFDPDHFPFLEGRAEGTSWRDPRATPLPVTNRTVLHLLEALQLLQVRVPGGGAEARRLSFKALDIEQIGHVYEGLLDHTALRATAPVLGLAGTQQQAPEVPLDDLERYRGQGGSALVSFLREGTGRSGLALERALTYEPTGEEVGQFVVACDNSSALYERVKPFAGLVRRDTFGYPVIVSPGSVYVTQGSDRRTTGTHYTPRSLTEPIVQYALEPLVYVGPADGKPKEEWQLRPARDLLALKVCDMAMGSGAFLVQACRYLSERLVEAWEDAEQSHPESPGITPEGDASSGDPGERLMPKDPEERLALARRLVTDRCLYGVDKNPLAVEMAKLSLWLITLQKDRPFTFLDHALRCGDSLLGVTDPKQIEHFHLDPERGKALELPLYNYTAVCAPALRTALEKRRLLESFPVTEIRHAEEKAQLLREAEQALAEVRLIGDLIVGALLSPPVWRGAAADDRLKELAPLLQAALDPGVPVETRRPHLAALRQRATELLGRGRSDELPRVPFHWAIEFLEVFQGEDSAARGFGAIITNPPFLGGQRITGVLGTDYRTFLVAQLARGQRGSADLCAYFFLRARQLVREGGGFGMLATNTIAQGDTREVGLEQLVDDGCAIPRAVPSRKWPGTANLEVAHVWVHRGRWEGAYTLDDTPVPGGITAFLTLPGSVQGKPYRLAANADRSFIGSYVLGMGFVLTPEAAEALIAKDRRNRDVLFPYLNGEDLNSRSDQSPSRWVINFSDWPLNREASGRWRGASEKRQKEWLRSGVVPADYPDPVAVDYPDCLRIVEAKVKPERQRRRADGTYALRKPLPHRWWHYAEKRPELYATIAGLDRTFVRARVSNINSVAAVPVGVICSEQTVIFAFSTYSKFAVLQAFAHTEWLTYYASSMRTDVRYTPSDCFETFPFPGSQNLEEIGARYHAHRQAVMRLRKEGMTATYNRFHARHEKTSDVAPLRDLHVEMDRALADAYGWSDLNLGHDFHQTKQGVRFTISDKARREVLGRLLKLNHERYAEEVRQGLHEKRGARASRRGGQADEDDLFSNGEKE